MTAAVRRVAVANTAVRRPSVVAPRNHAALQTAVRPRLEGGRRSAAVVEVHRLRRVETEPHRRRTEALAAVLRLLRSGEKVRTLERTYDTQAIGRWA